MKSNNLIALYSPAPQAGKTTIANYLISDFGYARGRFSDPIKRVVGLLLIYAGYDPDIARLMLDGDLKEKPIPMWNNVTTRYLMQTLGTDWGRNMVHPEMWVRAAMTEILYAVEDKETPVVVDDMRFPNEYDAMARQGATLIRVETPEQQASAAHASEGALNDHHFDYTIVNDGTVEDLYDAIDTILGVGEDD